MKNFLKLSAIGVCISVGSLCWGQGADTKAWANQIIEAQRGAEQTALLNDLSDVIAAGMVSKWNQKIIESVPEQMREKVGKQLNDELKQYKEDIFGILQKESINVEQQDLLNFYAEKFTPDELQAIAAWYSSSAYKKYQQFSPQLAEVYMKKLEERSLKALEARQGKFDGKVESIIKAANK